MNAHTNMLSVKKVKLHGMTSSRWTTKDKITQYKGMINLYTRDRKIIEVDNSVARKKQYKELKNLQKSIEIDRQELDNSIRGDKQQLRNTLAEHRPLQLAYQNLPPKIVIEQIHQANFNKRKELDKLEYDMKLRSQRLIDFKLEQAILEDRLKYECFGQLPEEKQAQIITGKVQDAILKKEAALAIRQTYAQIINIMKRDSLYFDAILITIQNDGMAQSKCLINATKLGQLATEYLDDRRMEYDALEAMVKKDLHSRKIDVAVVQEQAERASSNLKQLLRRDSDINTCLVKCPDSPRFEQLQKDLEKISVTLNYLQHSTYVTNYEAIYPCLLEQSRQKVRLRDFAKKCERSRDVIMNKMNHAELMDNVLENTMVETTFEYKARKQELLDGITDKKEHIRKTEDLIKHRNDLVAKVRISLRQLQQMTKIIRLKEGEEKKPEGKPAREDVNAIKAPHQDEIDGCKIIPTLTTKLSALMTNLEKMDDHKTNEAFKMYEYMMKDRAIAKEFSLGITDESLLEGLFLEVTHILTRDDIKKQSDEIVAINTKNDDLVPLFVVKKKRRKFK